MAPFHAGAKRPVIGVLHLVDLLLVGCRLSLLLLLGFTVLASLLCAANNCTGKRTFIATSGPEVLEMHRSSPAPTARDLHSGVSSDMSAIIARCLEKEPEQRYASATDLGLALAKLPGSPDVTLTAL